MKTGRKILLAVLGLVAAAGLMYIANWLWLGAMVRGELLQAFERRGAGGEAESDFYFDGSDANLRAGMPGAFHDFRQAVVVLKYSYETDSILFDGEETGYEPYEEYGGETGDRYAADDAFAYTDEGGSEPGGDGEALGEDAGGYAGEENGGESPDESAGGALGAYEPGDGTDPDIAAEDEGAYTEYVDGQEGDAGTYTTERVTSNVLVTAWLEFRDWRWQVVNISFLYQ